jgi:hypothetical protein
MKILIKILLVCIVVSSCGPQAKLRRAERKIARIEKKNPGVITIDTVWKDSTVTSPVIKTSVEIENNTAQSDTAAVDSLTSKFADKVQPEILDSLKHGFETILSKSGEIDTTVTNGETKIHYKRKSGKTNINIETTPPPIKIKYPVAIKEVKPPAALNWYERLILKIGKDTLSILGALLVLIILYVLYRIAKKEFF